MEIQFPQMEMVFGSHLLVTEYLPFGTDEWSAFMALCPKEKKLLVLADELCRQRKMPPWEKLSFFSWHKTLVDNSNRELLHHTMQYVLERTIIPIQVFMPDNWTRRYRGKLWKRSQIQWMHPSGKKWINWDCPEGQVRLLFTPDNWVSLRVGTSVCFRISIRHPYSIE